ncbi:MAG TPA: hypothetical protein VFT19_06005 [Solirubrobacterales bacterium]|nr:hypothetical protein [Solirubrobacterales bacterium]
MPARLAVVFPFLLAILLPPAGLLIGLSQLDKDRELGLRLIAVTLLASVVWVFLIVSS